MTNSGTTGTEFTRQPSGDDRIWGLDVDWLMLPTRQPWGRRSMMLRDPEGHLINVFEQKEDES